MKINKVLKTIITVMFSILLLFSILIDWLIKNNTIKCLVVVDSNFSHSIFSAIITVSTLIFTVMSIIISICDIRAYGIKLKEIITLKCAPINFKMFAIITVVLMLCSIPALAMDMINFLTVSALVSVLYLVYNGYIIFKIMYEILILGSFPSVKSRETEFKRII